MSHSQPWASAPCRACAGRSAFPPETLTEGWPVFEQVPLRRHEMTLTVTLGQLVRIQEFMSASSQVAALGGLSGSAYKCVLITSLTRVPCGPLGGHFLGSQLAVSLPQRSTSWRPERGDYLGSLLCEETNSVLETAPICAHCLRSGAGCLPNWPLSTCHLLFCR